MLSTMNLPLAWFTVDGGRKNHLRRLIEAMASWFDVVVLNEIALHLAVATDVEAKVYISI